MLRLLADDDNKLAFVVDLLVASFGITTS